MKYTEDGKPIPENLHEQQMLNEEKLYRQRVQYMKSLNKAAKLIDKMTSDPNERIILKSALLKSLKED